MCTVLLPPGDNPIAVNKYHIISYHIIFNLWKQREYMAPKYWNGDMKCAKWCKEVTLYSTRGNQTAVRLKEGLTRFLTFEYDTVNFCLRKGFWNSLFIKLNCLFMTPKKAPLTYTNKILYHSYIRVFIYILMHNRFALKEY
jgi:hypothetical protein